jgi:hypothetical protein
MNHFLSANKQLDNLIEETSLQQEKPGGES